VTIILTLDQAAQRASITRRTLERLRAEGEAPPVIQVSRRRVGISEEDLERWLSSRRCPAPGGKAA
jgi:excisionase family DNA binding protein